MTIKFKFFALMITFLATICLTSCGEPGLVIKNGPAGPNTGDMLDPLPEGLVPDKNNVRHSTDDLKPNIN